MIVPSPKLSRHFAMKIAFAAALGLASVPIMATASQGKTFMTQAELLAAIPGSTIDAKDNKGVAWAQSYSAFSGGKKDGVIKGNYGGKKYDAKWFVQDDQWCENWGDGQACWQVERVDEKSLRMYENGKPKKNLWKLR